MNEVQDYVARNGTHTLLNADEERSLIAAAQAGDKRAMDKIITHNMRLAIAFARQYHVEYNAGIDLTDLMQQAALGFMRAVEKFDPSHGTKFSTFATHSMRYLVQRYFENHRTTVRLPVERQQDTEIVMASLDFEPEGENGKNGTFGESLPYEETGYTEVEEALPSDFWESVLSVLNEREAQVIDLRYRQEKQGIEVADILGVSKQRVHQIEQVALDKMREAQVAV